MHRQFISTTYPPSSTFVLSQDRSAQVNYVQTHTTFLSQLLNAVPSLAKDFHMSEFAFQNFGSQDISDFSAANIICLLSVFGAPKSDQIERYRVLDILLRYQEALSIASDTAENLRGQNINCLQLRGSNLVRSHIDALINQLLNQNINAQSLEKFVKEKIKEIRNDRGSHKMHDFINDLLSIGDAKLVDDTIKSYINGLKLEDEYKINTIKSACFKERSSYFAKSESDSNNELIGSKNIGLNSNLQRPDNQKLKEGLIRTLNMGKRNKPVDDGANVLELIDRFKVPDVSWNSETEEFGDFQENAGDRRDYKESEAIASSNMFLEGCRRLGMQKLEIPSSDHNCLIFAIYQGVMGSDKPISQYDAQEIRKEAMDLLQKDLEALEKKTDKSKSNAIAKKIKETTEALTEKKDRMIISEELLGKKIIQVMEEKLGQKLNIYEVQVGSGGIYVSPPINEDKNARKIVLLLSMDHYSVLVKSDSNMANSASIIDKRKEELRHLIIENNQVRNDYLKCEKILKKLIDNGKNSKLDANSINNELSRYFIDDLNIKFDAAGKSWEKVLENFVSKTIDSCNEHGVKYNEELKYYDESNTFFANALNEIPV